MRFSKNWLQHWVDMPLQTGLIVEKFMQLGLEVASVEPVFSKTGAQIDEILTMALTPNRGDCLSIRGLAREIVAVCDVPLKCPDAFMPIMNAPSGSEAPQSVILKATSACPKYLGVLLKEIDNTRPTPKWMQKRLERSGLTTSTPLVDIGNYVMLELGQPVHLFDANQLQGDLEVRFAQAEESITLLNGDNKILDPECLVIADAQQVQAIAGIMGGMTASVTKKTTCIFIESAYFDPVVVAKKARALGLQTDAAYRFERGIDPTMQREALLRVVQLVQEIAGGICGSILEVISQKFLQKLEDPSKSILLIPEDVTRLLGFKLSSEDTENVDSDIGDGAVREGFQKDLTRLNMRVDVSEAGILIVTPPPYRHDIHIKEDLCEEIARLRGYDHIPTHAFKGGGAAVSSKPSQTLDTLKDRLVDMGYHETVIYSFVEPKWQEMLFPKAVGVALENPISSDLSVMRVNLLPGLLKTLRYNQRRQKKDIRLFEVGQCFESMSSPDEPIQQTLHLAGVVAGNAAPEQWSQATQPLDFFDIKGHVEHLFSHQIFQWKQVTHHLFQPGQTAQVALDTKAGETVGFVGAVHPSLLSELDIEGPIYAFTLQLSSLRPEQPSTYKPLSKFPSVQRDLSLLVNVDVESEQIKAVIQESIGEFLKSVQVFDVYQGNGVQVGKKSLALRMIIRDNKRTLTDHEVEDFIERALVVLEKNVGAMIRE